VRASKTAVSATGQARRRGLFGGTLGGCGNGGAGNVFSSNVMPILGGQRHADPRRATSCRSSAGKLMPFLGGQTHAGRRRAGGRPIFPHPHQNEGLAGPAARRNGRWIGEV